MSRKMNWGRMTAQYRNRQIRLAIARGKSRYKYPPQKAEFSDKEYAIGFLVLLGIVAYIALFFISAYNGW